MTFRNFEPDIEKVAAECRANCFTKEPFDIVDATRQGGATGALSVLMKHSGLTAWAKPEGTANNLLRDVAHEKIGSDLGFDLKLPVAPVAISRETNGKNLHSTVALSYTAARWATVEPGATT